MPSEPTICSDRCDKMSGDSARLEPGGGITARTLDVHWGWPKSSSRSYSTQSDVRPPQGREPSWPVREWRSRQDEYGYLRDWSSSSNPKQHLASHTDADQ